MKKKKNYFRYGPGRDSIINATSKDYAVNNGVAPCTIRIRNVSSVLAGTYYLKAGENELLNFTVKLLGD